MFALSSEIKLTKPLRWLCQLLSVPSLSHTNVHTQDTVLWHAILVDLCSTASTPIYISQSLGKQLQFH